MTRSGNHVAIVGAGPAGLMAAEIIAAAGTSVTVYDAMPSPARKFLMAGRGGLNLTHSEPLPRFMTRYREAAPKLQSAVDAFPPEALRSWSEALGEPTFVGSSGRVFPKAFKASPLLRAWLRRLANDGVWFAFRHRWTGWTSDGLLQFETPEGPRTVAADATVLALGGASWPRLGSNGAWAAILAGRDVAISPLRPANCGVLVDWSEVFRSRFEGMPLKGAEFSLGLHRVRGEAVVTRAGLEGGAIYALAADMREAVGLRGHAEFRVNLRPDVDPADLIKRLSGPRGKQSMTNFLRKAAHLSPIAVGLLQEAAMKSSKALASLDRQELAGLISAIPLEVTGMAPIARAISTAGGIAFGELDADYMIRRLPGTFAAGEMLDWEAPTGGYLLQASFATGVAAGKGVLKWLATEQSLER